MDKKNELKKDLRDISEEEFKYFYGIVKEKTNNFACLNKSLFDENPQYLIIIRLVLGLSQLELSKKLGTTNKQWIRHFEAKRQGFKYSKLITRCVVLINESFVGKNILSLEETVKLWKKSKAAREKFFFKPEESKYEIKKLSQITIEDLKLYFSYLRKETNNFTNWDPIILVNNPQFITIFRIILNLSQKKLALALDKTARVIRTNEYKEYKLMPKTAEKYMVLFERLFKEKNLNESLTTESCLNNFKKISVYDELENKIEIVLRNIKNKTIIVKKHEEILFNKKILNVDFVIYKNNSPVIAIEATKLKKTRRKNITHRLSYIDHRFQILKLKCPDIKTIIVLNSDSSQYELVNRSKERELINTDFCFVNQEFEDFEEIIKNICYYLDTTTT